MGLSTLAPFFFFIHPDFLLHVVSTTSFAQLGWCSQSSLPTCRSWPFHSLHQVVSTISFCTARMLLIRRSCARLPVPSPRPLSELCPSPRSLATPSVGAVPVSPFPRHALRRSCARLPVPSPRPPSELCPSPRSLATPSVGAVPVSPFPRHALCRRRDKTLTASSVSIISATAGGNVGPCVCPKWRAPVTQNPSVWNPTV